jgi:hypothetical protein
VEPDPLQNDLRKERRRRRFPPDAACLLCGQANLAVLLDHHIFGRHNDEHLVGIFCLNCHAWAHEALRDAGVDLGRDDSRSLLERIEMMLRSLAALCLLLASSLAEWAERLAALIRVFDASLPGWRDLEVKLP